MVVGIFDLGSREICGSYFLSISEAVTGGQE